MEHKTIAFEPLYDRILVRRLEVKTETGGVIIPDANKEAPLEGVVLQVGLGRRNEAGEFTAAGALIVKSGDHVLFGKYAGTEIKLSGEDLLVMREEEVLGITKRAEDVKFRHPELNFEPSATVLEQGIAPGYSAFIWPAGHTRGEM